MPFITQIHISLQIDHYNENQWSYSIKRKFIRSMEEKKKRKNVIQFSVKRLLMSKTVHYELERACLDGKKKKKKIPANIVWIFEPRAAHQGSVDSCEIEFNWEELILHPSARKLGLTYVFYARVKHELLKLQVKLEKFYPTTV